MRNADVIELCLISYFLNRPLSPCERRRPRLLAALLLVAAGFIYPSSAAAQNNVVGQWSSVMTWPYEPIHAHVLPSGKVLFWTRDAGDKCRLWDPANNAVTSAANVGANIFCGGAAFLSDGRLLVAGGHVDDYVGLPNAYIYNSTAGTWTRLPDMNNARWYPTVTTLPSGDLLVTSGWIDTTQGDNPEPQVWQTATSSWRNLSAAHLVLPFYPFMHVAPNGKVFVAGPDPATRYLDVSGTGAWSFLANSNYGVRNWGSSVMYDDGKVLLMGGITCNPYANCGILPTATAEIIDLNKPTPAWQYTASMMGPRKLFNATLLPDGKVFVSGGSRGSQDPNSGDNNNPAAEAEMWDPATGQWQTMASLSIYRGYHSIALLLPDGRVLSGGGDIKTSAEVYSPPYLFKGARPTISSAPANVTYGQTFFVGTPNATGITKVTMLPLPTVTHGFNMTQRICRPSFSQASGGLNVVAPSNRNTTPPGYYMLFILNGNGVPSVAKIMQVSGSAPPPTPTPTPTPTSTATATATPGTSGTPAAPTDLTASVAKKGHVTLNWVDHATNETNFQVERSSDGTYFGVLKITAADKTSYKDSSAIAGQRYYYRVAARNKVGLSSYSNVTTTP
jgi:galactose oxidase